ncbi:MAG: DAK2 domain-containing protein [Erysipelotrichaceae bacterium]|nr:DAK2 domain-containing protein [Erysipelotrichaceae bacterium]MBQ1378912.1 DAK2 domain-containing protein [Erysipelotrichaceae bacterium]MBQ2232641.1 DAK2 domain-containing protein [Erysipelotrichaceae bacterium]MBQ2655234.1 DAK2 domain-containing protein [Erysipelotrichaceae bacterium]
MNKLNVSQFKEMIRSGCANLENHAAEINTLNVFPVPDGDTGTNMSMTFSNGYQEAMKCSSDSISDVAKAFSRGLLMGARGNSGVITSQIFRGFYQHIEGKAEIETADVSQAFENGARVAYKAILKPVEGTILTVIREASWYANHDFETEPFELETYFDKLCQYSAESLERTPEYLPVLKEVGVVDSGGAGLLKILEGFKAYIDGHPFDFSQEKEEIETNPALMLDNEEFGYCTEFIIRLDENIVNTFDEKILKKKLTDMGGESLVVVKDEDLVKVHVHTLKPGDALNIGQRYGEFIKLKIENMQEQHSTIIAKAGTEPKKPKQVEEKPVEKVKKDPQKYGIVAVAAGEGVTKLFYDLGADVVVSGGQTMNPSTEDFVKVINELDHCENIFIFPNNSNIILAAKQTQSVLSGRKIYVMETKSVQAGLSAVGMFNKQGEVDEVISDLQDVIDNVDASSVTYAIKDTVYEGVEVKEGDFIAIAHKGIVASGKDRKKVVFELLDKLFENDEKELITLIVGEDKDDEEVSEIEKYISDHSDLECEVIDGGQPVYSYLIGLE